MIRQLRRWLLERTLVVVADRTYAALALLACAARMINPVAIVTRLRLDAALSDPAPVRRPGTNGHPRKKGACQPTFVQRLVDPFTIWQSITVAWDGGTTRTVERARETAVWSHHGRPAVAIHWVLIRDPQGQCDPQALLWTDPQASAQAIWEWFVLRWPLEVTFHKVRAHLGVEMQRQWGSPLLRVKQGKAERDKEKREGLPFVEVGKTKNHHVREEKPCQVSISQHRDGQKKRSGCHWISTNGIW